MAKFAELLEIDKAKPGSIPVDVIIEASDMANKDEIIEKIQQQQQAVIQGMAK
jgi:hypothetical protein